MFLVSHSVHAVFAESYSGIVSDAIYFNLSPITLNHSLQTWIWSRLSLLLPSALVKNKFSDEQRLDARADLSVMLMSSWCSVIFA